MAIIEKACLNAKPFYFPAKNCDFIQLSNAMANIEVEGNTAWIVIDKVDVIPHHY